MAEAGLAEGKGDAGKAAVERGVGPGAPRGKFPLVVFFYVAMVLAGTAFTEVVLVPRVTGTAPKPESAAESAKGHEAQGSEIYAIADLVINPADSGGMRYLAASVGLQSSRVGFAEEMKKREAPIKDALIRILGAKTTEELADVEAREKVRAEIKEEIDRLAPEEHIDAIYFLSFVLQ